MRFSCQSSWNFRIINVSSKISAFFNVLLVFRLCTFLLCFCSFLFFIDFHKLHLLFYFFCYLLFSFWIFIDVKRLLFNFVHFFRSILFLIVLIRLDWVKFVKNFFSDVLCIWWPKLKVFCWIGPQIAIEVVLLNSFSISLGFVPFEK